MFEKSHHLWNAISKMFFWLRLILITLSDVVRETVELLCHTKHVNVKNCVQMLWDRFGQLKEQVLKGHLQAPTKQARLSKVLDITCHSYRSRAYPMHSHTKQLLV